MTETTPDQVTAYLAEIREHYDRINRPSADYVVAAARLRSSADDIPVLLAVAEAVLRLHHEAEIQHRPGLADLRLCNGCGGQWPCPTAAAVFRALPDRRAASD